MPSSKKFFVFDVMAMIFRSFYALGRSQLARSDGLATGAIYGSCMFINKILKEEDPDYIAFVSDTPEKTFRHDLYSDYKAHRDAPPDELVQQIPYVFQYIEALGFECMTCSGYEADDIIGSLVSQFSSRTVDCFIVSGDKDFYQLINQHVFLYAPKKNDVVELVDVAGVMDRFGCQPAQVIDALAMVGDTADNVPGVKGIGEKGAAKLIAEFGSLDGIYDHIDEIKSKSQREKLARDKDQAYLSKKLVTIYLDLDVGSSLAAYKVPAQKPLARKEVLEFYEEFGFRSLIKKWKDQSPHEEQSESKKESRPKTKQGDLDSFTDYISKIDAKKPVYIWVELEGTASPDLKIRSCDILHKQLKITVDIPLDSSERAALLLTLSSLLGDPQIHKISYDIKRLYHACLNEELSLALPIFDLMVGDYLVFPNENRRELTDLYERYSIKDAEGSTVTQLRKLHAEILPELEQRNMKALFDGVEMPLLLVLGDMESRGIKLDPSFLLDYSKDLAARIQKLEKQIYQLSGREFNINSTKQLSSILFEELKVHEELKIKKIKKTKTGYSTDESVLLSLSQHPLPKAVLEYRSLSKLLNTWVDVLPQHIHQKTNRIHTRFNQTVAATGRLSSDKPNLQNIPMRSKEGRFIRKAFTASPGHLLISADYSQVEIRLLAGLAEESYLIKAFQNGEDIHRATAARIFGVQPEDVTADLRGQAKAVNFGIIYGMGAKRLAEQTGVSLSEAKDFIERYFEAYPGIKTYTESLITKALQYGYSETLLGRKRQISGLTDANRGIVSRAENIAVNAPIQGSAADIIKIAMIKLHDSLKRFGDQASLILQVHDELLVECSEDIVDEVILLIRQGMENAVEFAVPLTVEVGRGKTWYDAH